MSILSRQDALQTQLSVKIENRLKESHNSSNHEDNHDNTTSLHFADHFYLPRRRTNFFNFNSEDFSSFYFPFSILLSSTTMFKDNTMHIQ